MPELTKQDIKEVFDKALEPFALAIQNDFQKVENRLDKVENRLDKVEKEVSNIKTEFKSELVYEVKNAIKEEFIGHIDKLLTKADTIMDRMDKRDQEDLMHTQAHRRINDTLENHNNRIKTLETKYA